MIRESRIFALKKLNFGTITNLRKMTFVCREKEFYEKDGFGFWWRRSYGLGIIGKPTKQLKYFMFGFTFFDIQLWLDIKWVGSRKPDTKIELEEDKQLNINF